MSGLAAFLGLAVLALLYFSQARDVRRLREWAGRAPERAGAADGQRRPPAAQHARAAQHSLPATPFSEAAARKRKRAARPHAQHARPAACATSALTHRAAALARAAPPTRAVQLTGDDGDDTSTGSA